ncbi:MAG: transporter [Chlamydiota bacterium]|nr:transporter [Chlamydiota bacterium]
MIKSVFITVLCVGFICRAGNLALASHPFTTDDAGTVSSGHLEVEIGVQYANSEDDEYALTAAFTLGIIEKLDVGASLPYLFTDSDEGVRVNGFGDAELLFKWRFVEEQDRIPAAALTAGLKTGSGDETNGLGSVGVDGIFNIILTKGLGRWVINFNVGYNAIREPENQEIEDDSIGLGLSLEYPMTKSINIVGEVVGEIFVDDECDKDDPAEILFGIQHTLPAGTILDLGAGFGLTDGSPDYKLLFGITYVF